MSYPKMPAAEIKTRRENTNFTVKRICRTLRIDEVTWKRWETVDNSAPAFVEFLLQYVEATGAALKDPPPREAKTAGASRVVGSLAERFMAKIVIDSDSDCWVWRAGPKFKLSGGGDTTPRKAAWLVHHGTMPPEEIKATCGNAKCVYHGHLVLGRITNAGRTIVPSAKKAAILLELRQGKLTGEEISDKYRVSEGFVSALKKKI